jgi:hypothetical protein
MARPSPILIVLLLATALVTVPRASEPRRSETPEPPLFEALVRSVSVAGASLAQADVHVEVALRASRNVTVRRLTFRDSTVEGVPVWIEGLAGEWRLRDNEPFALPQPLRARVQTLDLLQMEHLAAAVQRRAVVVRTTVEVDVATPWTARLLFAGPTRPAIVRAEVTAPIDGAPSLLQPIAALTALLGERVRNSLSPMAESLRDLSPARRALAAAVSPSLATITASYDLVGPTGERQPRERRTLGFAMDAGTLCTTREALEPWRFDVDEAVAVQVRRDRLADGAPKLTVAWHAGGEPVSIDGSALLARLPRVRGRTLRTPVDNRVRRVSLLDRDSAANVVCLSLQTPASRQGAAADWRKDARAAGSDAAVFLARRTPPASLVWTQVSAADTGTPGTLSSPLSAAAFGSPVIASNGLVGMVVSDRGLRPAAEVDRAATAPVAAR